MHKYIKLLALFMLVLAFSACGNRATKDAEKIAVIKWEKAVAGHPEYARLQQGERVVKSLVLRRDAQAEQGKAQMGSLRHLRGLKQISEQSYYNAQLRAQLMEKEQVNKARLYQQLRALEKEAEQDFAQKRKAIEEEYRLRMFNLRIERERALGNVRPREQAQMAERLAAIDVKMEAFKSEREARLIDIEEEKQAYVSTRMEPYIAAAKADLASFAESRTAEIKRELAQEEGKYEKLTADAPEALGKALAVMDKEIDKQQDKNNELKKKINDDIETCVVKLAQERGYTIVFNTFAANVSAEDITADIVADLKKLQNK